MPRRRWTLAVAATIALGLLAPVAGARAITEFAGITNPYGVAVAPDDTAYLTNAFQASTGPLATIVGDTLTINGVIFFNAWTYAPVVEASGQRVFVTSIGAGNVAQVHSVLAATRQQAATYTLGAGVFPGAIAISRDQSRLFVVDGNAARVFAIGIDDASVTPIAVGANPEGVAVHPVDGRVYVASRGSGTITVIDPTTLQPTATIPGLSSPYGIAFAPDGSRAYVADFNADRIVVIDPATNAIVGAVDLGANTGPMQVAVAPDGSRVYASESTSSRIAIIDAAKLEAIERINLEAGSEPFGLALNREGTRLFVALTTTTKAIRIQLVPKAPTGLSIVKTTASGATIAFTSPDDNGAPITAFQYSVDGGPWTSPAYPTDKSPIVIDSLYSATRHSVRVRTLSFQGGGEASAPVEFTTKVTNRFSVGRIAVKVQRSRIVLTTTVRLPGPGTVRQVATTRKGKKKTLRRCSTKGSTATGGLVTLTCRIGAAGRKDLKKAALRLKVATTYKPTGGKARTIDRKVRVKRTR